MPQQEVCVERAIRIYKFSGGYVSVPKEDALMGNGGFLPGFPFDDVYFCFHCHDPFNDGRVLYRDVTTDTPVPVPRQTRQSL